MLETSALYEYAKAANAEVLRSKMPKSKSMIIEAGDGYVIGMDEQIRDSSPAGRVHLGHEVGHASTGSLYNIHATADVIGRHENDANKWAIEHLVPEEELMDQLSQQRGQVWELAEHFAVTEDLIKKALCWYLHGTLDTRLYYSN